jgi:hypothetical protein
MGRYLRLILIL